MDTSVRVVTMLEREIAWEFSTPQCSVMGHKHSPTGLSLTMLKDRLSKSIHVLLPSPTDCVGVIPSTADIPDFAKRFSKAQRCEKCSFLSLPSNWLLTFTQVFLKSSFPACQLTSYETRIHNFVSYVWTEKKLDGLKIMQGSNWLISNYLLKCSS